MQDIYTLQPAARYTAYVHTNHRRIKRYGNHLPRLITRMLCYLDNEFTYGWLEIIDNRSNEIVHRSRKTALAEEV